MPWFKVDDGFAFHRKVISAGNLAVGLWVRAGSWCAHQLTDGHIPRDVVPALGGTLEDADRLVEVGLWDAVDDGFQFRGWHDFQPSKESVIEEREKARKRKQAWRDARTNSGGPAGGHGGTDAGTNAETDTETTGETDAVGSASPTRPDPTRPEVPKGTSSGAGIPRSNGKATRIPQPWVIDEPMKEWALERNMQPNWVLRQTERFENFWLAKPGKEGTKTDWRATWRNWLLKAQDDSPAASPVSRNGYAPDDVRARFQ